MSGFVAVLNLDGAPVDRRLLGAMTDALAFRGPDAQHTWADRQVGLGHTLLATVDDFPEPPQPCSLDGRIWIIADARVDGRSELMTKLAAKTNFVRANASDPELILHAYDVWGEACVEHLLGDFAFVIWDGARERLFGARDHFGVKPLYFAQTAQSILVSNTIDSLRLHPLISGEINESAIGDFLVFGELVDPTMTAFADIQRLPAAHSLSTAGDSTITSRYWALPIDEPLRYRDSSDYGDQFLELLRESVGDRLRTDRISIFMSGGLDSPTVAAVARTVSSGSARALHAHTTVYDDFIPDDERHYASEVARYLEIPIEFVTADRYELYQEPTRSTQTVLGPAYGPLQALHFDECARVAERSRVVLTGYGGDPVLLPWPSEALHQLKQLQISGLAQSLWNSIWKYRRVPRIGVRGALHQRRTRSVTPECPTWVQHDFAEKSRLPERLRHYFDATSPNHPFRDSAYRSLVNPFWDFMLQDLDPVATGTPLEHRHPFLDIRLVRYLLAVPSLPWCVDKHLMREAMKGSLPETVRLRRKTPVSEDSVLTRLRKGRLGRLSNFTADPDLSHFADVGRMISPNDLGNDAQGLWTNLRPYSVNFWLLGRRESVRTEAPGVFAA